MKIENLLFKPIKENPINFPDFLYVIEKGSEDTTPEKKSFMFNPYTHLMLTFECIHFKSKVYRQIKNLN